MIFGNKKLLSEGVEAQGVVIDSIGPADTGRGGMGRVYKVKVRVQFPDSSPPAEFMQKNLDRFKHGWKVKGDIVPVRYDASDHSKIAVDVPALERERAAKTAAFDASGDARVALAEQELAGDDSPDERNEAE